MERPQVLYDENKKPIYLSVEHESTKTYSVKEMEEALGSLGCYLLAREAFINESGCSLNPRSTNLLSCISYLKEKMPEEIRRKIAGRLDGVVCDAHLAELSKQARETLG